MGRLYILQLIRTLEVYSNGQISIYATFQKLKVIKMMDCMICEKPVKGKEWFCNGAVLGDYLELKGHRTCIDNLDQKVVIPNRIRLYQFVRERGGEEK